MRAVERRVAEIIRERNSLLAKNGELEETVRDLRRIKENYAEDYSNKCAENESLAHENERLRHYAEELEAKVSDHAVLLNKYARLRTLSLHLFTRLASLVSNNHSRMSDAVNRKKAERWYALGKAFERAWRDAKALR